MLFDAFSLNEVSLVFWASIINEFSPIQKQLGINIVETLGQHIKVPRREAAENSISNRFGIHADNPVLYQNLINKYGFIVEEILYPDSHILPPFLEEKFNSNEIDKIKAKYCVQNSHNWTGLFMDYEFLAFLRKR
jgi:hypothetical protein